MCQKFDSTCFRVWYDGILQRWSLFRPSEVEWPSKSNYALNSTDGDVITEFVGALNRDKFLSTQEWVHSIKDAKRNPHFPALFSSSAQNYALIRCELT